MKMAKGRREREDAKMSREFPAILIRDAVGTGGSNQRAMRIHSMVFNIRYSRKTPHDVFLSICLFKLARASPN